MILSESEKNRIKGLYGLVTEAETAPPPDESVLVAKKNPFKDKKFKDAWQTYKSKMVDGDLFYVVDKTAIPKLVEEFYNNNFKGKTFRAGSYNEDDIFKFNDFGEIDMIDYYHPEQLIFKNLKTKEEDMKTKNGYDFHGYYIFSAPSYLPKLEFKINDNYIGFMGKRQENQPYFSFYKLIPENQINKFENMFKENLSVKNLPDEIFEIRKIQREKTDF